MAQGALDLRYTEQAITGATTALGAGVDIVYIVNGTVTLPATPTDRRIVEVWNTDNAVNSTIGRNGKLINGAAADYVLAPGQIARLIYSGGAWYDLNRLSTFVKAALDAKANTTALPLVYTAVVTSSDPTPTVAQERNQLGGAPAWTSNGQAGNSILTIADAFVNDRTNCQISGNDTSTPGNTYAIRRVDANTVEIACWDTSESLSELTVNVRIEVLPA